MAVNWLGVEIAYLIQYLVILLAFTHNSGTWRVQGLTPSPERIPLPGPRIEKHSP